MTCSSADSPSTTQAGAKAREPIRGGGALSLSTPSLPSHTKLRDAPAAPGFIDNAAAPSAQKTSVRVMGVQCVKTSEETANMSLMRLKE